MWVARSNSDAATPISPECFLFPSSSAAFKLASPLLRGRPWPLKMSRFARTHKIAYIKPILESSPSFLPPTIPKLETLESDEEKGKDVRKPTVSAARASLSFYAALSSSSGCSRWPALPFHGCKGGADAVCGSVQPCTYAVRLRTLGQASSS